MMVSGKQNAITWSSSLGEKERMPRMDSLDIDAIANYILLLIQPLVMRIGKCNDTVRSNVVGTINRHINDNTFIANGTG